MNYATCGGTESSLSRLLIYISNDFHKYGLNDDLRDCAWKIVASKSRAIKLDVHAIDGPSTTCDKTYLEVNRLCKPCPLFGKLHKNGF